MKKFNKNMKIIIMGALIATSTQMVIISYAEEVNNTSHTSAYATQNSIKVSNETELRKALEDPKVNIVEIKNNIDILNKKYIDINGTSKEIKGNGYTITHKSGYIEGFFIKTNTKIDNLKIEGGQIFNYFSYPLEIINNSEFNNFRLELGGSGLLENSKVNNSKIYASSNSVIKSSIIKNSYISASGCNNKEDIIKIISTEIDGKRVVIKTHQ